MMYDAPMLADFGVRLSFGLALLLLATNWQAVPLPFFRTQCQVILGLLVLAALDGSRVRGLGPTVWILIARCRTCLPGDDRLGPGATPCCPSRDLPDRPCDGWLAGSGLPERFARGLGIQHGKSSGIGFPAGSDARVDVAGSPLSDRTGHVDRTAQAICTVHGLGAARTRPDRNHGHLSYPRRHLRLARGAVDTMPGLFVLMRWGMGFAGTSSSPPFWHGKPCRSARPSRPRESSMRPWRWCFLAS